MPDAPLLAVDTPSLLYRAFHALPKTITGADGKPVNALLGTANLVLQAVEKHDPRAVVLCFGAEAATYRTDLYPPYHAARPEMPEELVPQWADAPGFFAEFGWTTIAHEDLEADDLLGALAAAESAAGGRTLLFTGDRDMFQCVSEQVSVLYPSGRGKGEPELVDERSVRRRYGVTPAQVPDFIALRGDPSDGLPGAKGIGEKTAAELLQEHGDLDALLALPISLRPRVRQALEDGADELRAFRHIATLQPVAVDRPPDAPLDHAGAAKAAQKRGMGRLSARLEAWGGR
jgi:5'-3' exonuclease